MHLIRIDFNDKKYALISTIKIKNALKLTMGGGGGGGGGGDDQLKLGGVVAHSIEIIC